MLLTNWGAQEGGDAEDEDEGDFVSSRGKASMWVKIVSAWLTALLYVWTLVAPRVMSSREFE